MPSHKSHNVSLKVGEWTDETGKARARSRILGHAFTDDEGRMYLRVNADALSPTLAALALRASKQKGEDTVIIGLWPIEDQPARATNGPTLPDHGLADDDIPFG